MYGQGMKPIYRETINMHVNPLWVRGPCAIAYRSENKATFRHMRGGNMCMGFRVSFLIGCVTSCIGNAEKSMCSHFRSGVKGYLSAVWEMVSMCKDCLSTLLKFRKCHMKISLYKWSDHMSYYYKIKRSHQLAHLIDKEIMCIRCLKEGEHVCFK